MDTSDFAEQYATFSDDQVLRLWAEQDTLVPEAVTAIEQEVGKRGLKKENAARVKRRLDALALREGVSLSQQVRTAKYERNMRHFIGWEEPDFSSPYSQRDPRTMYLQLRHRYRVWKSFRDHTGHWPVLSITYFFASWAAFLVLIAVMIPRFVANEKRIGSWAVWIFLGCFLALAWIRNLGAKQIRKLDWKRYGTDAANFR